MLCNQHVRSLKKASEVAKQRHAIYNIKAHPVAKKEAYNQVLIGVKVSNWSLHATT